MIGIVQAMAKRIRWGPRTKVLVAPANGRIPTIGRATAVFASIEKPRRSRALTVRTIPVPRSKASNRGGRPPAARTYSTVRYAPKETRNAAIPALTRGWFNAPAKRRLVDAARTRPPAVSAVIRMRAFLARGRAFFRGTRLGASGRPRILADGGAVPVSLAATLASVSRAGGRRVWATGLSAGIDGAGLDGTGAAGLGVGADSVLLAGEAGAGLGSGTGVLTVVSEGIGGAAGRAAFGGGTSETSGLSSLRNSSTLSSTRLTGRGVVA